MIKITKTQYEEALSLCNDYLLQESKSVSIINNTIKELLNNKKRSEKLDAVVKWNDIKKDDFIKIININQRGNSILKNGEILKVKKVNKQSFDADDYYKKMVIMIWAKIKRREYKFIGTLYNDDEFHSNCVFQKIITK